MTRVDKLQARRRRGRVSFGAFVAALAVLAVLVGGWRLNLFGGGEQRAVSAGSGALAPQPPDLVPIPAPTPTVDEVPDDHYGPINTEIEGLTTFRGNASRTYYGQGPVPRKPEVLWRHPGTGGMCRESTDKGVTKIWCGMGWTGQPNVVEWKGKTQVRFGAYDGAVHVLNGATGKDLKGSFRTGDIIKGTVTSDPDGYPLLYSGSRDNYYRILAMDRGRRMKELWSVHSSSAPNPVWNDDWDSSGLIIDDHLLVGGENSWFYVVRLNRGYNDAGKVTVNPQIKMMEPGFDDRLMRELGDNNVSIENSPAFHDGVVYFANSGGLVQGWDVSDILAGGDRYERVFRFWTGDDTDASIVIDDEGYLYVASELQRFNQRAEEVGQFMKLDPRKRNNPVVWKRKIPGQGGDGGVWATPGIRGDTLYVNTNTGRLIAYDRGTGKKRWERRHTPPTWSSPAIVDDVLIFGDCDGVLYAYDVSDPTVRPQKPLWTVQLEGCIEATPAVWKGMIYVGARGGAIYGIGDRNG